MSPDRLLAQPMSRRGVLAAGAALALSASRAGSALARPAASGTLHYYNWIDYVNPETYVAFTKATGIAVRRSYFASNEALLARLRSGARGFDLAAPTGYTIATLAEEGLLRPIAWKKLPNVRQTIDPKFLGLPHDPDDRWSVPKDWGTTGFMYRTDKIKERPTSWAQFFSLFEKYPRKLTLLDGATEVIGSVAVMMGYSFNTDADKELERVRQFLLRLRPFVRSFDSRGYATAIARGTAYGGLGWNGDGAYVIAHTPNNAAEYVVAKEGGELWVDSHVIPKGRAEPGCRARVDRLRVQAQDQRDGDALHLLRLAGATLAAGADPRADRLPQSRRLPARGHIQAPGAEQPDAEGPRGESPDLGGGEGSQMSETQTPISIEELRLAARNHAMPLEALRYPITPPGLHYLLIHYDIPAVDEAAYRLEVDGLVATPLSLSLDELRARPAVELAVTMECAGNGRALIEPHVFSQPWLQEAVGTARWRGTPLRGLLAEAGVTEDAVELVFTGLDHGLEGGIEQAYQRSLSLFDAHRPEVLLAYEMNGAPLAPQHGFPLRLLVPGWYGMTSVKWLGRITAGRPPVRGLPAVALVPAAPGGGGRRRGAVEDAAAGADGASRLPRVRDAQPHRPRRASSARGPCLVRSWRNRIGLGVDRRRRQLERRRAGGRPRLAVGVATVDVLLEPDGGRVRALLPRARRGGERAAAGAFVEPRRLREQRRPAHPGHRKRGMISEP